MRYSAIDKSRETNSGKKTDGHTEVHPDDSPLGEPGAEKLHAGIYWGRASQGARLPTIKIRLEYRFDYAFVRGSSRLVSFAAMAISLFQKNAMAA